VVWLTDARAPEGIRIYAIGDVHGCVDALKDLHRSIEADLADRPAPDWRIVHVGDYVDRGPCSREVIDFLRARTEEPRILCLRGNHDEMFARAISGDRRYCQLWLLNGGGETLESYGVDVTAFLDAVRSGVSAAAAVPAAHRDFLESLSMSARYGDYYFVHAGVDPARPLEAQDPDQQLWIREPFLTSDAELDAVIVHGHTPARRVTVRPNRIGIDTGAVFGGPLSCLVLEDASKALLSNGRLRSLPRPG
jgi:serine/threonine protein phosphatase 1